MTTFCQTECSVRSATSPAGSATHQVLLTPSPLDRLRQRGGCDLAGSLSTVGAALVASLAIAGTASAQDFGHTVSEITTTGPAIVVDPLDPRSYHAYVQTNTRAYPPCCGAWAQAEHRIIGTTSSAIGVSQYSLAASTTVGGAPTDYYNLSSVAAVVDPAGDLTGAKLKTFSGANAGLAIVTAGVLGEIDTVMSGVDDWQGYNVEFTILPEFTYYTDLPGAQLQYSMELIYGNIDYFSLDVVIQRLAEYRVDEFGEEYWFDGQEITSSIFCGNCEKWEGGGNFSTFNGVPDAGWEVLAGGGIKMWTSTTNARGPTAIDWRVSTASYGGGYIDASNTTTFKFVSDPRISISSNFGFAAASLAPPISSGVPEPSTWALLLLGFGSIGTLLRRRQRIAHSTLLPAG